MSFEIHSLLAELLDKFVMIWEYSSPRKFERKVCKEHPDWVPLTPEELSRIDRKDRWGYTIYKNMAPSGSPIQYYATEAPFFCEVVPFLNPYNHLSNSLAVDCLFSDKNYHETFMPELRFPQTVIRRAGGDFFDADFVRITPERALELLNEHQALVFKQTVETGHGTGIRRIEQPEFESVFRDYSDDYIVQVLIRQHPVLAYFNPSSVNVMRITTLNWRGDVYMLGGILRAGAPGAFCDHENKGGANYITIPIADDGTILPRPVDVTRYEILEDCRGLPVQGVIPGYPHILGLVTNAHRRFPQYKLIGWDVTVDEDGEPIFMEFNTRYPGITGTQCAHGAVLGRKSVRGVPLWDEIYEEIRKPGRKKRR